MAFNARRVSDTSTLASAEPIPEQQQLLPTKSPKIIAPSSKTTQGQDMQKNFSIWSVLGVGFSLTNSWFGISAAMVTGINSGGPVLLIYGIILTFIISICVGISLSELASALPNAGGQYFWTTQLAPKRYVRFVSYLTGWFAWIGSIFTSASVTLALGSAVVGLYQLHHPDFVIEAWHVMVAYELFNVFVFFFNTYGKLLPRIATATLYISLLSFTIIIVTVPTSAPTHSSAKFVFATFINNTGWNSNVLAYIVGLVNANWAFACLDCATHLAEEVEQPERLVPISIMGTVMIGFVTAWLFAIAMMFSIQDLAAVTATPTLVPILEIFNQVTTRAGATCLEILIICTGTGCLIASHTWQSRLCWSFARDKGMPGHRVLRKITPGVDVPLAAHIVSCVVVGLVGLLYLVSYTAFHSMVTATITLLYMSYSIPVICLLFSKGRDNLKHGPFWLGKVGMVANVVLLLWTVFTLVMYSFPTIIPVHAGNMNYVSAVYGVVVLIVCTDWFLRGKEEFGSLDTDDVKSGLNSTGEQERRMSDSTVTSLLPSKQNRYGSCES